jgi:hypothetical protein
MSGGGSGVGERDCVPIHPNSSQSSFMDLTGNLDLLHQY